jgi:hypothetical protein
MSGKHLQIKVICSQAVLGFSPKSLHRTHEKFLTLASVEFSLWTVKHADNYTDYYPICFAVMVIVQSKSWLQNLCMIVELTLLFVLALKPLFVGKPVGKRPLGRPRRRWVDYIRMNLGGGELL